jgi:hypothetical protein
LIALLLAACGDNIHPPTPAQPDATPTPDMSLSSDAAITTYAFETAHNSGLSNTVTASINGTSITATVPFQTDVTALVATFTTTGTSVKVGGAAQTSGTTANDFTNPVQYTVTAEDGTAVTYTVTIAVAASDAKDLLSFGFEASKNSPNLSVNVPGAISGTTITATVPFNTSVTALVATFATSGASVKVGTTVQENGVTANDFTSSVDYIVTAADGSTKTYTVIVTIALNSAKELGPFQFLSATNPGILSVNVTASIVNTQITAIVPFGTPKTNLIATFATTGESVKVGTTLQESGVTPNDFTNPVTYTVTAADGTTQDFIVTVDNSQSSDKDIITFSINGVDGSINGTLITLTVPAGTNLTALEPQITISGKLVTPGSGEANDFTTDATYVVTAFDNTTKTYTVRVSIAGQSDKDIIRFTINGLDAVIASTSATTGTIDINMPNGTDLTALRPVVTITGQSVNPASGATVDFSNGNVNYVVTAADGSTKTYSVSVGIVNGNGTKLITSFTILGVAGQITNGAQSSTVEIILPLGTDLTAQTPTVVINASSINPPSRIPQDFTVPVLYTVTAADGSTRVYTVTVILQ